MTAGSQFRPGPPPPLSSEAWARDYNEVKALGGTKSTARTSEQTEAVKFWEDAFAKLVKTKEFKEFMTKSDYVVAYKTAADTKAFIKGYNDELMKDAKYIMENK